MVRAGLSAATLVALLVAPTMGQFDPNWLPGWVDDVVTEIQVSNMRGEFDPTLGDLGVMDISPKTGGATITVVYENSPSWSITGGGDKIVEMIMNFYSDASSGGVAKGHFNGDNVGDPDWRVAWENILGLGLDVTFLEGTLVYFKLQEYLDTGLLAGGGRIQATSGFLVDWAGWPSSTETSATSFIFEVKDPDTGLPLNISDFSEPFVGDVYLTFYDDHEHGIPEPATLALLAGGLALTVYRRRR